MNFYINSLWAIHLLVVWLIAAWYLQYLSLLRGEGAPIIFGG
jgi:hypothetical protein